MQEICKLIEKSLKESPIERENIAGITSADNALQKWERACFATGPHNH